MTDADPTDTPVNVQDRVRQLSDEVGRVVVGQDEVVRQVLTAMFCRGHAVLVGVPGLAKTLLVSTIADALSLSFNRIQFTPDLMPSDITGTEVIDEDRATGKRALRFVQGPVFGSVEISSISSVSFLWKSCSSIEVTAPGRPGVERERVRLEPKDVPRWRPCPCDSEGYL